LRDAIERIYIRGDYAFFQSKCTASLTLPEELIKCLQGAGSSVVEFYKSKASWPSKKWVFHFPRVIKGEFEAEFSSELTISKILPLYFIQHEFSVKNQDEDKIAPILHGYFEQPYSRAQFELDDRLNCIFSQAGYMRLTEAMMSEVICESSFPKGVTIFGPQMTVEQALFNDVLGICV
jgi:hypothetical protein